MGPFDQLELRTARLRLRPLVPDDAEAVFAVFSDPEVTRYWSTPAWTSVDTALSMIEADRQAMAAGCAIRLGLQPHDGDHVIGMGTLYDFMPQCRRAEIGYALARANWGQGYMHEALTSLLDHGFAALNLNRVEADIDPRNLASARSLARLGFVREGVMRERWIVGDEISDTAFYGLLRRDWMARPTPGSSEKKP